MRRVLLVLAVFVGITLLLLAVFIPCYLRSASLDNRDAVLASMGYRAVYEEGTYSHPRIVPLEE